MKFTYVCYDEDDREIEVEATLSGGRAQTYLDPPEYPELEIEMARWTATNKPLTDDEIEKYVDGEELYEVGQDSVNDEDAHADYLYDKRKDERAERMDED